MFIVDAGDKTKRNNLSQKGYWLDKNNILLYTYRIIHSKLVS